MIKINLLKLFLLCSFFTLFISKASAQYAISGAAGHDLTSSVYWLTWGDVNPNSTGAVPGSTASTLISAPPGYTSTNVIAGDYVWQFSPNVQIRAKISNLNVAVSKGTDPLILRAYTPGSQTQEFAQYSKEDGLDDLYSGLPAGQTPVGVLNSAILTPLYGIVNFNIEIHLFISPIASTNAADYIEVAYPGMVIADGESLSYQATDGVPGGQAQELFGATTNGPVQFQLISKITSLPNYTPPVGSNINDYKLQLTNAGKTFTSFIDHGTTNDQGNLGVAAAYFAVGTTTLTNVNMVGGGFTGISLGFVIPFDLGDNPLTYGSPGHYIDNFATTPNLTFDNTPGANNTFSVANYNTTPLTPLANVYIGTNTGTNRADANGEPAGDVNSSLDDNDGVNDENAISANAKPNVKVNQSGNVVITLPSITNTKSATKAANLYAWIDFNGDGIFTQNEFQSGTLAQNTATGPVTFTFPNAQFAGKLKVGPLYSRFRVTTDVLPGLANPADNTTADPRATVFATDGEVEDYRLNDITGITISGTIFEDGNGATGGIASTTSSGTGTLNSIAGNQLYAYLADNSSNPVLIDKATVATDGTYTLSNENNGTYKVAISTVNLTLDGTQHLSDVPATIGPPAPFSLAGAIAVPSGASYGTNNTGHTAGEIQTGTPNLQISVTTPPTNSLDVTGVNFGINLAPLAVNDAAEAHVSETILIDVRNNDTDADGTVTPGSIQLVSPNDPTLRVASVQDGTGGAGSPVRGVFTVDATTNKIQFAATANFTSGTSSVRYTIKDNFGTESNFATATVTLAAGPTGVADTYTTTIGQAITKDVRVNDGNPPPSTATVALVGGTTITTAKGATVALDANQNIVYTPTATFTGIDNFQYTLTDNTGTSPAITVTVNVAPVAVADNTAPYLATVTPSTSQAVTVVLPVKNNDAASGTPTTTTVVAGTTTPAFGSVAVTDNTAQTFTYTLPVVTTATVDNVGLVTFNYKLVTGDGISSAFVPVAIPVIPRGSADSYKYPVGQATTYTQSVTAADGNGGVADPNGNTPGITVALPAAATTRSGAVAVAVNGKDVVYTPPSATFVGTDSYTYTLVTSAATGSVSSAPITVSIQIKPVGSADTYKYTPGQQTNYTQVVTAADGNGGVADPSGAVTGITVALPSAATTTGGTVAVAANGKDVVYTPPSATFAGTDSYTYTLVTSSATGSIASDPITVNIQFKPVASPDTYKYIAGSTPHTQIVTAADGNGGVADPSGAVNGITVVLPNTGLTQKSGTVTLASNSKDVIYTAPSATFVGADSYNYTLKTSSNISSDPVTVSIQIQPAGSADAYTYIFAQPPVPHTQSVATGDANGGVADANGNTPGIIVTLPGAVTSQGGSITVSSSTNIVTYTPPVNFVGIDTYTYTLVTSAATGSVSSAPITVTNTIRPAGVDNNYNLAINAPPQQQAVKLNDGDYAQAATVTVTNVTQPLHGAITGPDANGVLTYTVTPGYFGTDAYTYKLTANGITSDPINVTITISNTGVNDEAITDVNVPVTTTVTANDGGAATGATVVIATNGTNGSAVVNPDNTVKYTPNTDFIGVDTYTYNLVNGGTTVGPTNVTVTVRPKGINDTYIVNVNTPKDNTVKNNDGTLNAANTVTVTAATNPTHGSISAPNAAGVITYTPVIDYIGTDTYTYTLTNNGATSTPVTVNLAIIPTGTTDPYTTDVNVASTQPVKNNDGTYIQTTPQPVTITNVTTPAHGSVDPPDANGVLIYHPAIDYSGPDTYTYTLTSNGQTSNPIVVNIAIRPTGVADPYSTPINVSSTQAVKTNDGNAAQPSTVTVTNVSAPAHGTLSGPDASGVLIYRPAQDYIGTDAYTYRLTSNSIPSVQIPVTINIKPTGVSDDFTTTANTPFDNDVKLNDGVSGTTAGIILAPGTTAPANGTVALNGNTIRYTPNTGYTGNDTYSYTLTSSVATGSVSSDQILVTVHIVPVSTITPDNGITDVNTPVTTNVKANDGSVNAAGTVAATNGLHGITNVNSDGTVTYSPLAGFVGVDNYTYTLTQNGTISAATRVTITVRPVGVNDVGTTPINTPITTNVKANDGPSANATTVTATFGAHGGTTVDGSGNVTYTPVGTFTGVDTYTYTLTTTDGNNIISNPITVTINVTPIGTADVASTPVNTPVSTAVKINDGTVAQPDAVTVAIVTAPAHGTITGISSAGVVTYTPVTGYIGTDVYTYSLTINGVVSDPITVNVNVTPVGVNDTYTTPLNTSSTENVKANDGSVNIPNAVTVAIVTLPANGTATVNATTGVVTYVPNNNFVGTDTYTYTLTNNGATSAPITATINIIPAGVNDNYTTPVNVTSAEAVKINDGTFAQPNAVIVAVVTAPTHGTATPNANTGIVAYVPTTDYVGTDTYTYNLTANGVTSAPITVTVSIVPSGVNDTYITPVNTASIQTVKANDGTFAQPNAVTVTILTAPTHGTATLNTTTGVVTYVPANNYVGTDTYTYTLTATNGSNVTSDPIMVTITINGSVVPITFKKSATTGFQVAGDKISYTFTVTNAGTTALSNIKITDAGADAGSITPAVIPTLAAGATTTATATHTATATDVTAGSYSNQAGLTATDVNGNTITKPMSDDPGTTAADDPTVVKISGAIPGITIIKTGTISSSGTAVNYAFVIRNTGSTTLTSVTLTDVMLGLTNTTITLPAGGLLPGVGVGYSAAYTLTQANIDAGFVTNVASVTGTDASGAAISQSTSVTNTVPKAPVANPETTTVGIGSYTNIRVIDPNAANPIIPGTIEIVTQPKHGTVKINADGTITYIPNPGYSGPDSFTYRGKDARGFYTNNAEVGISVGFIPAFTIPTLFTPNGDGINDTFVIPALTANYPNNEIIIVNRWGNEVYHSTNYDGTWAGTGLNEGTYYYLLHIKNVDGSDIQVIKGYITLLRSSK